MVETKKGTLLAVMGLALLLVFPPPPVSAQDRGSDAAPEMQELRDAMLRFFETRVRDELGLSDEQFAAVMPLVREMEQTRLASMRESGSTMRELQRGMREGAGDAELQGLLDEWESIDTASRETQAQWLAKIDVELNTRQRVKFRFVTQRFRNEMRRRINAMRDGGEGMRGGRRRPGGGADRNP